jgi:hypothetical protein
MGREASLWDLFRANIGPFADLERVENRVNEGTPDVNYCINGGGGEGWIELKDIENWPARDATPVRIEHVTQVQREWWTRRTLAGGNVFVLLRVHAVRQYLLYSGPGAAAVLGIGTRSAHVERAIFTSSGDFPKLLILRHLAAKLREK